jgi:hypothetical protein
MPGRVQRVPESSRAGHVLVSTRSSRDNCRLAEWRTTGAKPALIAAGNVRHLGYEDIANVGTGLGGCDTPTVITRCGRPQSRSAASKRLSPQHPQDSV